VADSVLEKLCELQEAELQLRRLENSKSSHDRAAKVRLEQITKQKEHIEALRVKQRQARMAADKKELEVRQKRTDIEKLRQQQTLVRDNRQFSALQNEIKFAELSISKYEDEILTDFADSETIEGEIKKAQAEMKRQEDELAVVRREIEARKDDLGREIEDGRRKRDGIAKTLPPKVVDLFTRIADRLDGEALARVIRDEDDDEGAYVCGGCHMSVTQNTYVLLAGHNENLFTCPNCTRILFLKKT
jgi:predicted  nucleic acid-binding Zn-ribbon protein